MRGCAISKIGQEGRDELDAISKLVAAPAMDRIIS